MVTSDVQPGLAELQDARRESRALYWCVGVLGLFANLLMLTGPLYMLLVYDRVLNSRSVETLVALSMLAAFLYGIMGLLDWSRGRIMSRIGVRFQLRLERRVFNAVIRKTAGTSDHRSATGLRDLEAIQRLLSSPVILSVFDLPWTPLFLLGIWMFHPWLGMVAAGGGLILVAISLINQWATHAALTTANRASTGSDTLARQLRDAAETVQAAGMGRTGLDRWQVLQRHALGAQIHAADLGGSFVTLTRVVRLILQAAMLGVGAFLVLRNELSPGAMIAGSILMGRTLAPVEQTIAQWRVLERAYSGWQDLRTLLTMVPPEQDRIARPRPEAAGLQVHQVSAAVPGQRHPTLKSVSFAVGAGQAIGIIGPSGSGKSTLARTLTGLWKPAMGRVALGGVALDQFSPEMLGDMIGYLPQQVQLFDGTIADNIARMAVCPDADDVVRAARAADAHAMILTLPEGYETQVSGGVSPLSGGQLQRIGLARAFYDDPLALVLDEPNASLDNDGCQAMSHAIRAAKAAGKSVVIMANRPAAIRDCDMLLVLNNGAVSDVGTRDEILRKVMKSQVKVATGGATTGDIRGAK